MRAGRLRDGNVRLTLQNPSTVDPGLPNVTAPDATTEYAITSLSINFFADERKQVDYLFVFDEDSVADDTGALTSADGAVLDFAAGATDTMTVDTAALQAVARLSNLTDLSALAGRRLEITVGPGTGRAWTIASVTDLIVGGDAVPGVKRLTLTPVAGGPVVAPTNRSEFRIAGGDTHGRVVGFGMGPNVLFAGKPEPGGITYGDIEVTQVGLGSGNDTVRVDYTTNAEDHTTRRPERGGGHVHRDERLAFEPLSHRRPCRRRHHIRLLAPAVRPDRQPEGNRHHSEHQESDDECFHAGHLHPLRCRGSGEGF